jgi:uncharacterized protein YaeQ
MSSGWLWSVRSIQNADLQKRKNYWVDISAPDGERIRRSAGTEDKKKAQQYHDKIKHELWNINKLDKRPDHSFDDIIILAMKDAEDQALYETKKGYAKYWRSVFKGARFLPLRVTR